MKVDLMYANHFPHRKLVNCFKLVLCPGPLSHTWQKLRSGVLSNFSCHIGCNCSLIGASLSELHTSGTALRKCCLHMYVRACLQPYTVNFKSTFKYFLKIERPCVLSR